jgi:hypothetical protein
MATSILSSVPHTHRPIHDYESIFWLCALDLLERIGSEDIKITLANIMNSGNSLSSVAEAKLSLFTRLSDFESEEEDWGLDSYVILEKPKDSSLFFCLTALMREFLANKFARGYRSARKEIDGVCFDRCIEIIQGARDAAVAEGIAAMSLSS